MFEQSDSRGEGSTGTVSGYISLWYYGDLVASRSRLTSSATVTQ